MIILLTSLTPIWSMAKYGFVLNLCIFVVCVYMWFVYIFMCIYIHKYGMCERMSVYVLCEGVESHHDNIVNFLDAYMVDGEI